jgi:hypothetical protein
LCLGDTSLILGFLAKQLLALELVFVRCIHRAEALLLWKVLFQRVFWVYGFVCSGSVASRILQDDPLASWVLL